MQHKHHQAKIGLLRERTERTKSYGEMASIDKDTRMAIAQAVQAAVEGQIAQYAEEWVTAEELCKKYQMFNKDWLKRYGHSLPRTCALVTDENGETHKTRWAYASHQVARMIANNEIKQLRCLSVRM